MSSYGLVVVGGGVSAGYFCRGLVAAGKKLEGGIAVISAEAVAPYERPALTKAYLHPPTAKVRARLPGFHTCVGGGGDRQLPEWYKENGIDLHLGTEVTKIDLAKKVLDTSKGPISFQKLLMATGARAATGKERGIANAEVGNVFTLRSEAECAALVAAMEAGAKELVVVGGGYIGLEVAAALVGWGVETTVVVPEAGVMARVLPPVLSAWMQAQFEKRGVKFLFETTVTSCQETNGVVSSVVLSNGSTLPAQAVVLGLGAFPNTGLVAGQLDMTARQEILVDGQFCTSVPDVYAVGDIAAFPFQGKPRSFEHVGHARSSASAAAATVTGSGGDYTYLPFFYSRVFEYTESPIVWNHFGDFGEPQEVPAGEGQVCVLYTDAGKVVGGILCGCPAPSAEAFAKVKALVEEKKSFSPELTAAL